MNDNPNKKWTADDFHAWREAKAAELEAAQAQYLRRGSMADSVIDDFVIRSIMILLRRGMTLEEAGHYFVRNNHRKMHEGVLITEDAVLISLRSIGWLQRDARKNGVGAI